MNIYIKVCAMHKVERWDYPVLKKEHLTADGKLDIPTTLREFAKLGIFAGSKDTDGCVAFASEFLMELDALVEEFHKSSDERRVEGPMGSNADKKMEDGDFATVRVMITFNHARGMYKVGLETKADGITYQPTIDAANECAETCAAVLTNIGKKHCGGMWYFTFGAEHFAKLGLDILAETKGGAK